MTKTLFPLPLCSCGKAPAYQDGLCIGCYSIRTIEIVLKKQELGECQNCGKIGVWARDRCKSCYEYHRRHGEDRGTTFRRGGHRFCQNCGNPHLHAWGRCAPCDTYWRRHGIERPQRLIQMYEDRTSKPRTIGVCTNCGASAAHNRPECTACRHYRQKRGKVRPERLWRPVQP